MKPQRDLVNNFKPEYFWDVDISGNTDLISKRLIVERIFSLGTVQEIKILIDFYGRKEVAEELMKTNYLDAKTLNFAAKLFNKSKKSFRCYTRNQLMPQHWNS
jgi:hypothetical protein